MKLTQILNTRLPERFLSGQSGIGSGRLLKSLLTLTLLFVMTDVIQAQSTGDYRTRTGANGSWFSRNTWQRFSRGSWRNAWSYPTSSSGAVEIRSDASVTVNGQLLIDQLTVNGNLTVNTSANGTSSSFTLNNGTGTDLVVNGTFIYAATGSNANFSVNTGATWSVAAGATYVHNSARSVTAALNAVTLNPTSRFIYRGSSTLAPSVSLSGRTYGHLLFESTSGVWNYSLGGGAALNVQGDLAVGAAGNVNLNLSTFTGTINVTGTTTVSAGSTFSTNSTGVMNTGHVNINGTINLNTNVNSTGNWVNGSAAVQNSTGRTVVFNSSGDQSVTRSGAGPVNFGNVVINKPSGNVNLSANVTVSGTLTLTSGKLNIGSNTLTLNGAVSRTGGFIAGSHAAGLVIAGNAGNLHFGSAGTDAYLKSLTVNNGASATLATPLQITAGTVPSDEGVVTVTGTGVLNTGGNLTLKSNANGTARIAAGRTTGGYINGNVTVERYIPQTASKAWRLLASTTSGQTIRQAWQENQTGFNSNTNPGFGMMIPGRKSVFGTLANAQAAGFDTLSPGHAIFTYDPATDNLLPVANTNATQLSASHGYFVFVRGDRSPNQFGAGAPATSTVLRSTGTLFQGNQPAVNVPAGQYALVRNPYASRIDMRQIVRTGGLAAAYQVWDPKLSGAFGVGGYQTFTRNTVTGNYEVSPGGGSYGANGSVQNFIESGLAFFVQAVGTSGTVQVTEACKTSGSQVVHRPAGGTSGGGQKRILFNVYAVNGTSTDMVDGGYVDFNEVYSNNVDVYDVKKSPNFGENFGIQRNGTDLVVERRSGLTARDTIPFRMYNLRTISYRIDLQHTGLDPLTTKVILEDKFTGSRRELNATGTTEYTFTVTSASATRAQDRFRLLLSNMNEFTGSGDWTDVSRWSLGRVPAVNESFSIGAGADASLNTDFELTGTLTMGDGSRLTVNPGRTLSIGTGGVADFKEQSVVFKSDATGYGSLGQVTGTLMGASNITVERYIPNNGFRSWRLLSVPTYGTQTIRQSWQENNAPMVNGKPGYGTLITGGGNNTGAAQAAGFDFSGANASMLTWNGTGWSNITGTLGAISAHPAYFLYVRGDRSKGVTGQTTDANATTLRTTGNVYTGDQSYSIPSGQFAVVPNPYASAIDFTQLQRSGVANTYYVWDAKKQNGNQLGAYQTFAGPDYECLLGGGSYVLGSLNNTVIESGQAFLVRGTTGGNILIKETAKRGSSSIGNLGLRPVGAVKKLKAGLYAEGEMLDAAQVRFGTAFSNEVNGEDADKLGNPGVNLAVEHNQRLLAVEGRGEPGSGETVIRYRMWNLKPGTYRLELEEKDLLAEGLEGEVRDSYTGQVMPLQATGTTKLNFTVNGDAASAAPNRFTVVLRKNSGAVQSGNPGVTVTPNPVQGPQLRYQLQGLPAGNYQISLYNSSGKRIIGQTIQYSGSVTGYLLYLPAGTADGVYTLLVSDQKFISVNCKVLVNNKNN